MYRTWSPDEEIQEAPLGWVPGEMPALDSFGTREVVGPMGEMG
jgi:hypothetical protein